MAGVDPGFPMGGMDPFWGGIGLLCGCFSVKMDAKTKELGPIGKGVVPENFVCRSASGWGFVFRKLVQFSRRQ